MKKLVLLAVSLTLVSGAIAHEGHEHATGVVRERMILMTHMGDRLLAIAKRLRANKELNRVPDDALAIRDMSDKVTSLFPPGSTQAPTAAKPAVWKDWADFTVKANELRVEAEKLMKADTSDGKALREQFRALAYACDGCHQSYRFTKSN